MIERRAPDVLIGSLLALCAWGCDRPGPGPRTSSPDATAPRALATDEVHPLDGPAPFTGPRARGRKGDWVVRNAQVTAVFRARDGRLVDLGPSRGGRDTIQLVDTVVSDTRRRRTVTYDRLGPARHPATGAPCLALEGRLRTEGLDLEVRTLAWAPAGERVIALETTVTNQSPRRAVAIGVGDSAYLGNTRHVVPGRGLITRSGRYHAAWIAREELGETVALVTGEATPMLLDLDLESPAFNADIESRYAVADLPPGGSLTARRYLLHAPGPAAEATAGIQGLLGGPRARVRVQAAAAAPEGAPPTWPSLEVTRDGHPVLVSSLRQATTELTLPAGHRYRFALRLSGAGLGPVVERDLPAAGPDPVDVPLALPPWGTLRYAVTEAAGAPMPGRIRLRGTGETPTPRFGDDEDVAGAVDTVYTASGRGARILGPGTYHALVTRGLEYEAASVPVRIIAGQATPLAVALRRVVDTPGALSGDLHLHAAPSPDSNLSLVGRLTQLAASGVEYAVATDHNEVTDYAPDLRRAGLQQHLVVDVGTEITTRVAYWGHFNLFPLRPGHPLPDYTARTVPELFASWRALPGRPVIQVNHPRMGRIGYFNQIDLDLDLGRSFAGPFEVGFHALEVFNGDYVYQPDQVERDLTDWFALLNRGIRVTATGNSDAHKLGYQEAGFPRSYLHVGADDPAKVGAEALREALRAGRVVVSSGPYVRLEVAGKNVVGETLRGPATVALTVAAPCWVSVAQVRIIENGRVVETIDLPAASRAATPVDRRCTPVRLQRTLTWKPAKDAWYVVVARGTEPLPILPGSATGVFGFTNPVWIDADGDGRLTPPGGGPARPTR